MAKGKSRIDLKPKHARLSFQKARNALRGILDLERFHVTFISVKGPLGWLLRPLTVRGAFQALGTVPLLIRTHGQRVAVAIGRLPNGRIPIRFDSRLLRNLEALKAVARHEVAEVNAILPFEGRFKNPQDLQQLLERADDIGYAAE